MSRRLCLAFLVVASAGAVPAADAAFPMPVAQQGGEGLVSSDGAMRYVAVGAGDGTVVKAISTRDGSVVRSQTIAGSFGVPRLTQKGPGGGLLRDGSAFVLQSTGYEATTSFRLISTSDLGARPAITLRGTFFFDALSPDGSKLFLIQHTSADDLEHYVVRVYDLATLSLLPGEIADKSQAGWVMQGFPAARATSADGRWVYTLYMNPGGYPFVHALDTVNAVAHCVGFAWPVSNVGAIADFTLGVKGRKLLVRTNTGVLWRVIDRRTWRVTKR